jgi:hypothetical protein
VFQPCDDHRATRPDPGDGSGLVGVLCVLCWFGRGLVLRVVSPPVRGGTRVGVGWEFYRAISNARLHGLPRFHLRPIDVLVWHGPRGRPRLEGGFLLRCLQQLSRPHLATQLCHWRDNWCTRGASIPVLSY